MEQSIIDFITEDIHGGDPTLGLQPEDDLLISGLLGSMDMMRVVEFLERTYGFRVPPEDMAIENFVTVAAMAGYVSRVTA